MPPKLLLTVVLFVAVIAGADSLSLADDCAALRALYTAADGKRWLHATGWAEDAVTAPSATSACCEWYGVECGDGDRVVSLDLMQNRLNGTLPPELSGLSALRNLSLGNFQRSSSSAASDSANHLYGTLPPQYSAMTALQNVLLPYLHLSGSLPSDWETMKAISTFDISANVITGTLPRSWRSWSSLRSFVAEDNRITGEIPSDWETWTSIEYFSVSLNTLSGGIPAQLSAWTRIRFFLAIGNILTTPLPVALKSWTQLESLLLSNNRFTGTIPSEYSSWQRLQFLELSTNRFSGTFAPEWSAWSEMRFFYVFQNSFSGVLPSSWATWTRIEDFWVQQNELTGSLPSQWSSWAHVSNFYVSSNSLSGSLPKEWSALTNMTRFHIYSNDFVGQLPDDFSSWTKIEEFFGSVNFLTGSLPDSYSAWERLEALQLSYTEISGPLPPSWSAWPMVVSVSLCSMNVSGTLPSEWGSWETVVDVAVCLNSGITGTIPSSWSAMRSVQTIVLSLNSLTGSIPSELNALPALSKLSVVGNRMHGSVALCGASLQSIEVAHNQFSSVGDCMVNTTIVTLDLSYNNFTSYPQNLSSKRSITVLDLSNNAAVDLDMSNLQLGINSPPVVSLANNPDVRGDIAILVGNASPSSTILLDLSNTSVSGKLSDIDPGAFVTTFVGEFPFSNLLELNVAGNAGIHGALPVTWFNWAAVRGGQLTLNVSDVGGLCAACHDTLPETCEELAADNDIGLPFDCSALPVAYAGSETQFYCRPLAWGSRISVIGLNASYFQYRTCECAAGLRGTPPHCKPAGTDTGEVLGLAIPFALAAVVLVVVAAVQIRRWLVLARVVREAQALLDHYALPEHGFGSGGWGKGEALRKSLLGAKGGARGGIAADWVVPYGDVRVVRVVAAGAEGKVSLAVWNRTTVALKEFIVRSDPEREDLLGEALVHMQLRHPNIVQLLGVCVDPPCTITEWMERGSLFHIIQSHASALPDRMQIARDIAKGMLYLHKRGVIHRDLKSLNVLLDARGTAKVADFGTARKTSAELTMTMQIGTVCWMAPEVFETGRYTEKCDVYSFAIILWELCTLQAPKMRSNFMYKIAEDVCAGVRPEVPPETCDNAILLHLMQRCWLKDPDRRPSFDDIVTALGANSETGNAERDDGELDAVV